MGDPNSMEIGDAPPPPSPGLLSRAAIASRPPIPFDPTEFSVDDDELILKNIGEKAALVTGILENKNILLPIALRTVDKSEAAAIESVAAGKVEADKAELLLKDLNDMVATCLGKQVADCLKAIKGTIRDTVETASPTMQCNSVLDTPLILGTTECWICGSVIPDKTAEEEAVHIARKRPSDKKKHPLSPECEHIFPVAQALCFTGLYEHELFNTLKRTTHNNHQAYIEGLKLEYRWAHRICNQVKNDTHFIKIDGNRFQVNRDTITPFIRSILTNQEYQWPPLPKQNEPDYFADNPRNSGSALLKKQLASTNDAWVESRVTEIANKTSAILQRVSHITAEDHALNTVKDFQAYAVLRGCKPQNLEDAVPVVLVASTSREYTDIYTDDYLSRLTETTLDRLDSLCIQSLLKQVANDRNLLTRKESLRITLIQLLTDAKEKTSMPTIPKTPVAAYTLNARGDWQMYQKIYYMTFLYGVTRELHMTVTKYDGVDPLVKQSVLATLAAEMKNLVALSGGLVTNYNDVLKAQTHPSFQPTLKRWGIEGRGGRRTRRRLPKLL